MNGRQYKLPPRYWIHRDHRLGGCRRYLVIANATRTVGCSGEPTSISLEKSIVCGLGDPVSNSHDVQLCQSIRSSQSSCRLDRPHLGREYKTLLEKKEAELAELKSVSEINAKHEEYFKLQLEDELKTMTEGMAKIVTDSGKDTASQLQMAKQLKSEMGVGVNSPSADRPSAIASTGDVTTLAETIKTETDMLKKSKMIFELKSKADAFSKQVLDLIK